MVRGRSHRYEITEGIQEVYSTSPAKRWTHAARRKHNRNRLLALFGSSKLTALGIRNGLPAEVIQHILGFTPSVYELWQDEIRRMRRRMRRESIWKRRGVSQPETTFSNTRRKLFLMHPVRLCATEAEARARAKTEDKERRALSIASYQHRRRARQVKAAKKGVAHRRIDRKRTIARKRSQAKKL